MGGAVEGADERPLQMDCAKNALSSGNASTALRG